MGNLQKNKKKKQWYYRWAPSLGDGFSGSPEDVWGVKKYDPSKHINEPCVFCGLYGLPDFIAFRQHKGEKMVWYAGSDIRHFVNGWWIDDKGKQRVNPKDFVPYLKKFENWVENTVEADLLKKFGIKAKICPSFLGDVRKFKKQKSIYPSGCLGGSYYSSVSGNDFKLYGWDKINKLAKDHPEHLYWLYGNTIQWKAPKNVIVRGRMSQEKMDEEIKCMTGCIRLIPFEGFSEIVAKAILWGQEVISEIPYNYNRETLLKVLNRYPWCNK